MAPKLFENHYVRLGLPFHATPQEIRRAYHEAAKRLHPDTNSSSAATDAFLKVQEAFDVLSDPGRRESYDRSLQSVDTSPGIRLHTILSREALLRSADPQLVYALVQVDGVRKGEVETSPPVNLCLVIDRSTSMQGKRMDMVKSTAQRIIRQIRPADVLSVVAFSDRAEIVIEAARERDPKKMEARISLIQTSGGTELFYGLKEGYQQVLRHHRASAVNHLILITDGHTYGDEEKCLDLAEKIKASGITISALGIGGEWNERFLDRLAARTGGSSVYAARARDIQDFLEQKFSGLHEAYAESLRFEFTSVEEGVQLRYAFRTEPEPTRLETNGTISLGTLTLRAPVRLLLEIVVQSAAALSPSGFLMQADVRCEIPGREIPAECVRLKLALPLTNEIAPPAPPAEIIRALSKLTLYRMQEQARVDLEAGDFETATRRLRQLATHMLASGEGELASTIMREVGRLETDGRRTRHLEKSIMYGTKTLILK